MGAPDADGAGGVGGGDPLAVGGEAGDGGGVGVVGVDGGVEGVVEAEDDDGPAVGVEDGAGPGLGVAGDEDPAAALRRGHARVRLRQLRHPSRERERLGRVWTDGWRSERGKWNLDLVRERGREREFRKAWDFIFYRLKRINVFRKKKEVKRIIKRKKG